MTLSGKVCVIRIRNRDYSYTFRLSWWDKRADGTRKHLTQKLWRTPADLDHDQRDGYALVAKTEAKGKTKDLRELDKIRKVPVDKQTIEVRRKAFRASMPYAVRDYLEDLESGAMSPSWREQLTRVVRSFQAYMAEHEPSIRHASSIWGNHVEGWRSWRQGMGGGIADSTLLTECAALQPFFDWLKSTNRHEWEVLALTKKARSRLHANRSAPNIPEDSHLLDMLRSQPDDTRRRVLGVLAGTGLRSGELKGLRVKDYHDSLLSVPKNGRETTKRHARDIPLGPWLTRELQAHCWARHRADGDDAAMFVGAQGSPLTRQINTWLKTWGHTPHDLRRWFSNTLLRFGCPDPIRCALMAHTLNARDSAYYVPTLADKRPWTLRIDELLAGHLDKQDSL